MRLSPAPLLFGLLSLLVAAAPLGAQKIGTERVASGLARPVLLLSPPGDADRLFVLEENTGRVRIIKSGTLLATPFLDIGPWIATGGEQGLLGMAFHPDYARNGDFFLHYSDTGGKGTVSRWTVSATNPDVADPGSERILLTQNQPYSNHNGGMLAFGPNDGYLYIGFGDGGSAGDPHNNAQSPTTFLGKMLRIDVDAGTPYGIPSSNPFAGNPAVLDEIWALGLRNPWRWSFDRATGDMWIGDVGQNTREEIDFQPGTSAGGENYGWKIMEGTRCFSPSSGCNQAGLTLPFHDYQWSFSTRRTCVIGGYVYRGGAIPGLQGAYFFADYGSDEVWTMRNAGGAVSHFQDRTSELDPPGTLSIHDITSFGEDAAGELYILDHAGGEVFQVVPRLMDLSVSPLVAGRTATGTASGATPGRNVFFAFSTAGTGAFEIAQLGVFAGIASPVLVGMATADASGTAVLQTRISPLAAGAHVWLQAVENGNTSNVIETDVQ